MSNPTTEATSNARSALGNLMQRAAECSALFGAIQDALIENHDDAEAVNKATWLAIVGKRVAEDAESIADAANFAEFKNRQ